MEGCKQTLGYPRSLTSSDVWLDSREEQTAAQSISPFFYPLFHPFFPPYVAVSSLSKSWGHEMTPWGELVLVQARALEKDLCSMSISPIPPFIPMYSIYPSVHQRTLKRTAEELRALLDSGAWERVLFRKCRILKDERGAWTVNSSTVRLYSTRTLYFPHKSWYYFPDIYQCPTQGCTAKCKL